MDSRIITALITSRDVTEAAKRAGVSRTTVYNKLHDKAFAEALDAERRALSEIMRERIADAVEEGARDAIAALRRIAQGEEHALFDRTPDACRMQAADRLLALYTYGDEDGGIPYPSAK